MNRTWMFVLLLILAPLSLGCQSRMGRSGCAGGECGLLGGGCSEGSCGTGDAASNGQGAMANYEPHGGHAGVLGELNGGRTHRGPQSHLGPQPGPAVGPAAPTVTYPYYTTRGPRDFLNPNPPSIGP